MQKALVLWKGDSNTGAFVEHSRHYGETDKLANQQARKVAKALEKNGLVAIVQTAAESRRELGI